MARPTFSSSDKPLPIRFFLKLYEFASSLKLAVLLIFSLAAVLGWATFIEMDYGLKVVHFALYSSWWFGLLGALLAVNIFCAAVIRYPWKRYQTGFVITHIGLLTLLFGCLLTRRGGIDAQMAIFEGDTNYRAYSDEERIELAIHRESHENSTAQSGTVEEKVEVISIPFQGGPLNWQDLDRMRQWPKLADLKVDGHVSIAKLLMAVPNWLAWNLTSIDRGVLYDEDRIRVEVLDHFSNSEEVNAPRLRISMTMPQQTRMDEDGRPVAGPENWVPVDLVVNSALQSPWPRKLGFGDRKTVGGGNLIFWLADGPADVAAFLDSRPQADLGVDGKGQVILHAAGQRFPIKIEDHLSNGPFLLDKTGLSAEVTAHFQKARPKAATDGQLTLEDDDQVGNNPAVELTIRDANDKSARLVLFADLPEFNVQAPELGVFGSYWVDPGKKSSEELIAGQGGSRIDLIQGPDEQLFYRYWNRHELAAVGELPLDGTPVNAFKMPIAQLKMKVARFVPAQVPGKVILPLPFNKSATPPSSFRAVKLRTTVDGHTEEFWLVGPPPGPYGVPLSENETHRANGDNRDVTVSFPLKHVDVGFQVRLKDFERKLDPGTSQASHYSSTIDLLEMKTGKPELADLFITMNAPIDFSDPQTGRSYRLFQESFVPPMRTGQPFASVLTVNYDPGRGVKYVGCLLVVAGIVTMFYMRAYFFKPKTTPAAQPARRELVTV